ncbi:MAG: hypothetical protein R6V58_03565 [Planctomycetota bacterium]
MWDRIKAPLAVLVFLVAVGCLFYVVRGRRAGRYTEKELGTDHQTRVALHGDEPRAQVEAAIELGKPKDTPEERELARATLEEVVQDKGAAAPVTAAAARSLGKMKDPRSVPAIARRLEQPSEETTMVKFAAIKALERIADPSGFEALTRQVTADNSVATDAAWAMGELRDPDTGRIPPYVEDKLIEYLKHPAPKIRIGAIYGLEEGGTEKGLAALRELAKHPFRGIRPSILEQPLPEMGKPKPGLILAPCRRAIQAIEARIGAEPAQGGGE